MQGLMHGKRGLIMGVANDHSIAWGIAKTLAAHGASVAFTFQGDALAKRVPTRLVTREDAVLVGMAAIASAPDRYAIDYASRAWV